MKNRLMRVVLTLLLPGALGAETVFLRNGQYVSGELVGQTATTITLRTRTGTKTIEKTKIRRIIYTSTSDEEQRQLEERAKQQREQRERERLAREKADNERRAEAEKAARERERVAKEAAEKRRKEEEEARAKRRFGPFDGELVSALWRSAVLPGWGQTHQGRADTGRIYGGVAVGTLFFTWWFRRTYVPRRADYTNDSDVALGVAIAAPDSTAGAALGLMYGSLLESRDRMQTAGFRTNLFFTAFVLNWAWNLVDVVIFRPSQKTALFFAPMDGPGIGVRISF